jgi:hypothetical protein
MTRPESRAVPRPRSASERQHSLSAPTEVEEVAGYLELHLCVSGTSHRSRRCRRAQRRSKALLVTGMGVSSSRRPPQVPLDGLYGEGFRGCNVLSFGKRLVSAHAQPASSHPPDVVQHLMAARQLTWQAWVECVGRLNEVCSETHARACLCIANAVGVPSLRADPPRNSWCSNSWCSKSSSTDAVSV